MNEAAEQEYLYRIKPRSVVRKHMTLSKALYIFSLLTVTLGACTQSKNDAIILMNDTLVTAQKVLLREVAYNPQTFNGQYVEVEGKFSFNFEDVALYDDAIFSNSYMGLWINFTSGVTKYQKSVKELSGKSVVIRGKVNSSSTGHNGGYFAELDNVYFIQQK